MKPIYPFSEMQVGDVREVSTRRSLHAVRSAGYEWSKKHPNEDGSRPKFRISEDRKWFKSLDSLEYVYAYRIERTA